MTFSQILEDVIRLSKETNEARAAGVAGRDAPPVTSGYLPTATLPATDKMLREFLDRQPPEVIYLLITLLHLGRGDFAVTDLASRIARFRGSFPDPRWAVNEMMGRWALPDFLERSKRKLEDAGIDLDTLARP